MSTPVEIPFPIDVHPPKPEAERQKDSARKWFGREMRVVKLILLTLGERRNPRRDVLLSKLSYQGLLFVPRLMERWKRFWPHRLHRGEQLPLTDREIADQALHTELSSHAIRMRIKDEKQRKGEQLHIQHARMIIAIATEFFRDSKNDGIDTIDFNLDYEGESGEGSFYRVPLRRGDFGERESRDSVYSSLAQSIQEIYDSDGIPKKNGLFQIRVSMEERKQMQRDASYSVRSMGKNRLINQIYGGKDMIKIDPIAYVLSKLPHAPNRSTVFPPGQNRTTMTYLLRKPDLFPQLSLAEQMGDPAFITGGRSSHSTFSPCYVPGESLINKLDAKVAHAYSDGASSGGWIETVHNILNAYIQDQTTASLREKPFVQTLPLPAEHDRSNAPKPDVGIAPEVYVEHEIPRKEYDLMLEKIKKIRSLFVIFPEGYKTDLVEGRLPRTFSLADVFALALHMLPGIDAISVVVAVKNRTEGELTSCDIATSAISEQFRAMVNGYEKSMRDKHVVKNTEIEKVVVSILRTAGCYELIKAMAAEGHSPSSFFASLAGQISELEGFSKWLGEKLVGEELIHGINRQCVQLSIVARLMGAVNEDEDVSLEGFFSAQSDGILGRQDEQQNKKGRDHIGSVGISEKSDGTIVLTERITPSEMANTVSGKIRQIIQGDEVLRQVDGIEDALIESALYGKPEALRKIMDANPTKVLQLNLVTAIVEFSMWEEAKKRLKAYVEKVNLLLQLFLKFADIRGINEQNKFVLYTESPSNEGLGLTIPE